MHLATLRSDGPRTDSMMYPQTHTSVDVASESSPVKSLSYLNGGAATRSAAGVSDMTKIVRYPPLPRSTLTSAALRKERLLSKETEQIQNVNRTIERAEKCI
ncbi:uncharacterized protein LOC111262837 [Varroa jacobsoni]|uniref:uncharacterized protein LOC111262837 n=1 Tax=Varroa jacobsoni TaxID=62625 RepID=UPI000BF61144|nr:uncharacterized protein LOC111262837 [Varroa jacobsoni]